MLTPDSGRGAHADGQSLSNIAHIWRIVMRHADVFYPHIANFDAQFVQCMYRMISTPAAAGLPVTQLVELCSTVLNLALTMAYWVGNLLGGQPLAEGGTASGVSGGTSTGARRRAGHRLWLSPSLCVATW